MYIPPLAVPIKQFEQFENVEMERDKIESQKIEANNVQGTTSEIRLIHQIAAVNLVICLCLWEGSDFFFCWGKRQYAEFP